MTIMKAVCINDSDKGVRVDLTYEKAYEVIGLVRLSGNIYKIINDIGEGLWYGESILMPLEEWRDQQLNEILKEE
jgi:hypothetical protein